MDYVKNTENIENTIFNGTSRYNKVVILLIDALRYDFVAPNASENFYYSNRFKMVQEVLENENQNCHIFHFIADAPTITSQRLYGLTTGTIPSFLDMKDNFAAPEIKEDNILYQLNQAKKRITFMGDDTWISLYPNTMDESYPYDSFNVRDLYTVDNGCHSHLTKSINQNKSSLIISHFLGVDHIGHRYEANAPLMAQKLDEMNRELSRDINIIDNQTLLLMFGDHGMTAQGDHGGESKEEIEAGLFMYSKQELLSEYSYPLYRDFDDYFIQIDLVSTLSLLYNIPIPFSNIGHAFVPLINYPINYKHKNLTISSLFRIHQSLTLNLMQIYRYINEYDTVTSKTIIPLISKYSKFTDLKLLTIFQSLKIKPYKDNLSEEEEFDLNGEIQLYLSIFNSIRLATKEIWESIDVKGMINGIILSFTPLIIFITLLFFNCEFTISSAISLIHALFLAYVADSVYSGISHATMIIGLIGLFASLTVFIHNFNKEIVIEVGKYLIIPIIMLGLHLWSLFSNSYIENENHFVFVIIQIGLYFVLFDVIKLYIQYYYKKNSLPFMTILYPIISLLSLRKTTDYTLHAIESIQSTPYHTFYPLFALPLIYIIYTILYNSDDEENDNNSNNGLLNILLNQPIYVYLYFLVIYFEVILLALFWGVANEANPFDINLQIVIPRTIYIISIILLIIHYIYRNNNSYFYLTLLTFTLLFSMIIGPNSPIMLFYFTIFMLSLYISFVLLEFNIEEVDFLTSNMYFKSILLSTVGYHLFYITGHVPKLNRVQYNAGFIGLYNFNFFISGGLVLFNTFGCWILLFLFVLFICHRQINYLRQYVYVSSVWHILNTICTLIFILFARRHLMLKDIFIPKLLFDIVTAVIVLLMNHLFLPIWNE